MRKYYCTKCDFIGNNPEQCAKHGQTNKHTKFTIMDEKPKEMN